ncbi:hypothetical protein CL634_10685 [bacterium]|nr:hypothetical protein [bacterium]|tara:strand:- start:56 stop:262 length:207 start_codon:yes stop_codon:yes gene_type:complete
MKVLDAKPKEIIQVECAGSYDPDSTFYLITTYQDRPGAVRAVKALGGGYVHLHPDNNCRVITHETVFG